MPHQIQLEGVPGRVEVEGVPEGARLVAIPHDLAKAMIDARLHAYDLGLASDALAEVKTDTREFAIANTAAFSTALVFYFRCFKSSASRERLDPRVVFADKPDALKGHRFIQDVRDKHVVHDENNYFAVAPCVALVEGEAVTLERIYTFISHAGIDREAAYVDLLRNLISFANAWNEAEAERKSIELAAVLAAMPRTTLEQWPSPTFSVPKRGDERKKR